MPAEMGKKRERRTNERRRVGLVEGRKDRFEDFWSEVLTAGELGRQISRQPDMAVKMEERTGDRIKGKKQNISFSS